MRKQIITRARDSRVPAPVPQTYATTNDTLANLLGYSSPSTVSLTESSVRGLPGINAGVDKVANAVAMMMHASVTYNGTQRIASPLIVSRPCPLYGSFEFWQMVVRVVMMRGNFVALIASRDEMGEPTQVVPVHPDYVDFRVEDGLPIYDINGYEFSYDQVIHVRSHAPIGSLWGMGIIERYRKSLSSHLYEQNYAETSFKSGGVPTAIVRINTPNPTKEQIEAVNDGWLTSYGSGLRKPAIVGQNVDVVPLSWSPQDTEFVASRQFSIAEAALITGLRPEDLGASIGGSGLTYGNRTDDALQRVTDSYSPWLNLIEQAWSDLLPVGQFVEGSPEALFRMSTRERLELAQLRISMGISTADEVRLEELAPTN